MTLVRTMTEGSLAPTGLPGFTAQFLAITEMAAVVGGRLACGGAGPALHIHPCDQYYVVTEGTMRLRLGPEVVDVPAGSFAVIPAGIPHCNWNDEDPDEVHIELLAPMVRPGLQHFTFVDSSEPAPEVTRRGYVVDVAGRAAMPDQRWTGATRRVVTAPEDPGLHVAAIDVEDEGWLGEARVTDADQLLLVVEGRLEAAVGGREPQPIPVGSVLLLGAGVVHRLHAPKGGARFLEVTTAAGATEAAHVVTLERTDRVLLR